MAERPYRIIWDGWAVPIGFASDGCTMPWWLWKLASFVLRMYKVSLGDVVLACVWHDWARRHLTYYKRLTAAEADRKFRELLIEFKVPEWLAYAFWVGVVLMRPFYSHSFPVPSKWNDYLGRFKV